ncbi:4a-hydroxytetrahydrobiopterin dehydratase [Saccharothrix xinjiangensis]|uniref:Putative pterin-4-alpha-carbinolamine dehydratase n=1 Tax=Saccharothrix xinjiangensis TaxID=204798 RepID=A0ABV9XXJ2_9PSEU
MPKAELLTDDQLDAELVSLPLWRAREAALERTVELASFPQAVEVVNRVAEVAERDDHHPDIDIRRRTLTFRCWTHVSGGITALDVSLAQEVDAILDALA